VGGLAVSLHRTTAFSPSRASGKRDRFIYYSNRDLTMILSYTVAGISEHGIFHGIR
jgi:hypothetical protein